MDTNQEEKKLPITRWIKEILNPEPKWTEQEKEVLAKIQNYLDTPGCKVSIDKDTEDFYIYNVFDGGEVYIRIHKNTVSVISGKSEVSREYSGQFVYYLEELVTNKFWADQKIEASDLSTMFSGSLFQHIK